MAKPLNVLFLSSEVEPFAKTGGLADVSGALPQTIKNLSHEIRVMMPRYGSIDERRLQLHEIVRLRDVDVPVGKTVHKASVKSSFLSSGQARVQVYFLDNAKMFGRTGLYVHPTSKKEYADNDARFIFFCRGVLEVLKRLGWQPDIIHCNDWPTGLVPAYLKTVFAADPFYRNTRTVFTIHNMAYQGRFPAASFGRTMLPPVLLGGDGISMNGSISFLKAGLMYADAVTTVSRKYAREIQSGEEYGCGLQDVVRRRKGTISGILNGVDYSTWNPEHDVHIARTYSAKTIEGKQDNRSALLDRMGLPEDDGVPVIGMISRLDPQKGFDLLDEVLDELMDLGVRLIVLGVGEKRYQNLLTRSARKYRTAMAVRLAFDESLAHLIEAGADMFLMPSRYEPCGLNQIYSLRYGTVPIVRATGGLDDTIEEANVAAGTGTGFKFSRYDSADMMRAIRKAVRGFGNAAGWRKIMRNGMAKDFSWTPSAREYVELYKRLVRS